MATDSPGLPTVIREAISARLVDVHTAMPGRVESYDAAGQTADVQPQLKRVVRSATGERTAEELPVIPSVPVGFPGGGGFFVSFPLAVGDTGLLIFSEYSIDRWRTQGEQVDPADERRHGLSGAIFVPGLKTQAGALADADATHMRLGADGSYVVEIQPSEIRMPRDATAFLARADRVLSELQSVKTAFDAHTHAGSATAPTGPTTPTGPPVIPLPSPSSPASDTVKGT